VVDALVVVVDRDRQHLLGMALADHIIVQDLEDLGRRGNALARLHERGFVFLADDLHAQFDAFIADEHGRARNQLTDLVLALSAEGAIQGVLGLRSTRLAHSTPSKLPDPTRRARKKPARNRRRGDQLSNLYTTTIKPSRSRIV
jgi:hypothetical protein